MKLQQKIDAAKLDSYAGSYSTANVTIPFARQGDQLSMEVGGQKTGLLPVAETAFHSKDENWELTFAADKDGKVRAVAIHDNSGRVQIAYRAEK